MTTYSRVRLTLMYETLPYDILSFWDAGTDDLQLRRYITKIIKPTSDMIPLPRGTFNYVKGSGGIVEGPGKVVPTATVEYIWRTVPADAVPWRRSQPDRQGQPQHLRLAPDRHLHSGDAALFERGPQPLRGPLATSNFSLPLYDVTYHFAWRSMG